MGDVWTIAALKKHFDARFNALQETANERSAYFEKRMDGTNEWRASLNDLTKTMASREALDAIAARLKRLEDADIKSGGRTAGFGQLGTIAATSIATAAAVVAGIAAFNGVGT